MIYKLLKINILFLFFLTCISINLHAEANLDEGKVLFKNNCAQCHNKNMKDDLTGPALGGIQERWEGREEVLSAWIRNSQAVIATGDKYAVNIYNKWNKVLMNPFPELTDQEIENILGYIDGMYTNTYGASIAPVGGENPNKPKESNTLLYTLLLGILAVLALVLGRIISNLNHMAEVEGGNTAAVRKTLWESLTGSGVIGMLLFGLVVLGGYTTVNNAIEVGRQQGYAPEQPIKFSHATHAGLQQIDCQYCHDGARRSKHSVIPAANTCMNCHKAIKKGSKYGTSEISKIFASIGFDPSTDKYIEGYENMTNDEIKAVFEKWIGDTYIKENKLEKLDSKGEKLVNEQWDGIVSSLTNKNKKTVAGPIEWTRIHNLPDHVYFNHAQHVTVGKVECQNCHGPVEKMEIAEQYAPLSMGWCINCHRETEVQFTDNKYYDIYENYHTALKNGDKEKVTVEDIGGLECQKCHY